MTVLAWAEEHPQRNAEEQLLLGPLLYFLRRRRWISQSSVVHTEFAWNGRRADLVTLTTTARTAAYELKLGAFHRVLEQAMYNRLAFDRSWVVVANRPLERNLQQAAENGIGVMLLHGTMEIVLPAAKQPSNAVARKRLLDELRKGKPRGV